MVKWVIAQLEYAEMLNKVAIVIYNFFNTQIVFYKASFPSLSVLCKLYFIVSVCDNDNYIENNIVIGIQYNYGYNLK